MEYQSMSNGASLLTLPQHGRGGAAATIAQSQNFTLQWLDGAGASARPSSPDETIVIVADGMAQLDAGDWSVAVEGPAVAIVPGGSYAVTVHDAGPVAIIATQRDDIAADTALNYPVPPNDRVAPVRGDFTRRVPLHEPQVYAIADLPPPPDNGRLRFLQSETISINFVLYDGARGSDALSPHAHADIEQGSLAIFGDYVHHLRVPWGRNAADWRDDVHLAAGAGTLLLIPPTLIHTTEGVGEDRHMLIDVFAPPRRDFIAKGWMANAADYADAAL